MDDINLIGYQKNDYQKLRDFVGQTFQSKYILGDEKFLDWQYSGSGALLLAKVREEIVGFLGYKDFPYKIYGETKEVRVVMNFFAAPKYRRAGVGPRLAQQVFSTPNCILVSGYNDTAQSLYEHLRANWTGSGDLFRFFSVLAPHKLMSHLKPLASSFGRKKALGSVNIKVTVVQKISKDVDEFWQTVRDRYSVTIERGSEYLKWRYLGHPFFDYQFLEAREDGKLLGFLIYRFEEVEDFKIARIIDFVSNEVAEVSLLKKFLDLARTAGAQAADFMFSGQLYQDSLKVAGFFDVSGTDFSKFPVRFNPISYSKFNINIACDIQAPIQDMYLTKGDSDQDRPNPH
ncbi:MAG: GNAT family N-acetyltransferase [Candidatus Paceibacterota bacterium]|jgi:predicted acetyltransferase